MSILSSYKDGSLGGATLGHLNDSAFRDGSLGLGLLSAYQGGSLGLVSPKQAAARLQKKRASLKGCGCAVGADAAVVDTSKSLQMGLMFALAGGLGLFLLLRPRTA